MPYKDPGTKSQSGTASTPAEKSTGTIDDWLEAPARKNSTASLSTANGDANGVKTPQGGTPFGSTAVHNTGKDGLGIENDSSAKTPNQNQPESDDSEMPKEVYINSQKDLDAIIMTSPAAATKNYDRKTAIHMGIKSLQNLMNHVSMGHDLRFTRDGSHTLNRLISQVGQQCARLLS
ncbi:hypothetical protein THAOC_15017 [Thalassiosira oceanica]|uniref:Uncharacterized protein n=1 Tax=Thalassiosira oceanica TaxID=159749 RepID=K0STE0_THAOC|nr:hypothetical protein THAOC_15017 [Thalassiosira oceanica]|eukprot:EJK64266.1 hypothetical protein THAOC_15017 [Thalassiosira oceanica]